MKLICGQTSHLKILSCISTLRGEIKYLRAITIFKSKDNSVSTLFEMHSGDELIGYINFDHQYHWILLSEIRQA